MPAAGVMMISAGAAVGVTEFAGAMMVIGGVLSTVGYVTENKDLQTAGSVLGLVGGISSIANGAAATEGTASDLATASAKGTAESVATETGAAGTTTINASGTAATPTELSIDSGSLGGTVSSQTGTGATVTNVGGAPVADTVGSASPVTTAGTSIADPTGYGSVGKAAQWSDPGIVGGSTTGVAGNAAGASIADTLKSITSSKEFWNGSMQALGGWLQGQGNQKLADAQLDIQRQKLANASQVPVFGKTLSVNPNASPFITTQPTYVAPNYSASIMGAK